MITGENNLKYARQKELIEIIQNQGYLNAASAAEAFGVSIATIRRDLKQLEHQGLLEKKYGGAQLPSGAPIGMPVSYTHLTLPTAHRHAAFYFSPEPFPRQ